MKEEKLNSISRIIIIFCIIIVIVIILIIIFNKLMIKRVIELIRNVIIFKRNQ